ncbi:MAG: Ppx/GppA family phosphatase [Deltaproteobacteria bacterium]|nr:Ppx/GppA family phosphatase [Deltaproteobacteria bacterium]
MKLATLDVGTNTVLMLVAERDATGNVHAIADFERITRLGRGVDSSGHLDPGSAAQTLAAVVEFAQKARDLGAEKIVGAATAALRDVSDGAEFIAQVKAKAGIDLEIITGETEAELSYLAVSKGLQLDPIAKILIVDIGGGSTELIRAQPGRKLDLVSLQLGAVRLTERLVHHDPPTAREAADLRLVVNETLQHLGWDFTPDLMVGIAGTVTTVCAVKLGLTTYDPKIVHGYRLSHEDVMAAITKFGCLPLAERKKLPGLEAGRADVIFAGTAILERIMGHFHLNEVIVSDQGVRWGLLWRTLDQLSTPQP